MLSARERTLLAPHLALLRTAQRELAAARSAFDEADRGAAEAATGTDWRDRMLGGLLSVDEGRARSYRRSRGARKSAAKALADATGRYEKYAERMDGLLEPILARDDPAFRARLAAVHECDKALRACVSMRDRLADALARPGRPAKYGKDERERQTWHEAEFARRRFDELAAELRTAVPALRRRVERVAGSLGEPPPVGIDLEPGPVGDRQMRALRSRLDAAVANISGWRSRADKARVAALRAAHDTL